MKFTDVGHVMTAADICSSACSALELSSPLYKRDVEISDAGIANLAGTPCTIIVSPLSFVGPAFSTLHLCAQSSGCGTNPCAAAHPCTLVVAAALSPHEQCLLCLAT